MIKLLMFICVDMSDRPQPPVNVSVRCETTMAEIEWQPGYDGNDEIISYTVYYGSSESEAVLHGWAEVGSNVTSSLIPVRPWCNYTFTVLARNNVGRSDGSEPVYCTTLQTAPFEHPRNVCSQARLSSQLVIVWQVVVTIHLMLYRSELTSSNRHVI